MKRIWMRNTAVDVWIALKLELKWFYLKWSIVLTNWFYAMHVMLCLFFFLHTHPCMWESYFRVIDLTCLNLFKKIKGASFHWFSPSGCLYCEVKSSLLSLPQALVLMFLPTCLVCLFTIPVTSESLLTFQYTRSAFTFKIKQKMVCQIWNI